MTATPPLLLCLLPSLALSLINNRKPEATYVIPIYQNEEALVHCVSYFAETIFAGSRTCDPCRLKHVQHACCRAVTWNMLPLQLRCTSHGPEWADDDPNIPFIDVSVVQKNSGPLVPGAALDSFNRTVARSTDVYFCNKKSNVSHLTAGSHIGLGWTSREVPDEPDTSDDMIPTEPDPFGESVGFESPLDHFNDNARHKEAQFSSYYAHDVFRDLWISEDIKVELKAHNTTFTCNETQYILPRGSTCMTPSARALFVMTNCGIVERVFIVIGVIVLLVGAYVVFNVLLWLWDFISHYNSKKYDEDKVDRQNLISS